MQTQMSKEDKDRIEASIHGKYIKVAQSPEGLFKYPTGRTGLKILKYDPDLIGTISDTVINTYCGVGNPFSIGPIYEGEAVLDIGCGAGVDTLLAAMMAGPGGMAIGIDLTTEMLERAEKNLELTRLKNVKFQMASGENLPFEDNFFDVIISNGVINLIPDKAATLKEAMRVLKPGGRLMIADQILKGTLETDERKRIDKWAQWEGGAIPGKDFLAMLEQTGFEDIKLVEETGLNSSPKTRGALFQAKKPIRIKRTEKSIDVDTSLDHYQEFMDSIYAEEGALGRKIKHLVALSASLAAGCEQWTQFCLAGARQLGTTDEELKEVMALAMTVGSTKIRIQQENALTSLMKSEATKISIINVNKDTTPEEACSTWAK